jgi:hypothetical protein
MPKHLTGETYEYHLLKDPKSSLKEMKGAGQELKLSEADRRQ